MTRWLAIRIGPAVCACGFVAVGNACSVVTTWDGLTSEGAGDAGGGDSSGSPDAGPNAFDGRPDKTPAAPVPCAEGEMRCGGHEIAGDPGVLYRCAGDGGAAPAIRCMYGCVVGASSGSGDACGVCALGGRYCGGDKISGDPKTLYRCNGDGTTSVIQVCPNACAVRAGRDDECS